MAKTEIAKASDTAMFRPQDIFSTMRHEMDRMFERFEHGFPRCPHLFHAESGTVIVPVFRGGFLGRESVGGANVHWDGTRGV